jgi:hypothetical protein
MSAVDERIKAYRVLEEGEVKLFFFSHVLLSINLIERQVLMGKKQVVLSQYNENLLVKDVKNLLFFLIIELIYCLTIKI